MSIRFIMLAALLAVAPASLVGCGLDTPTATRTVQLAVIAGAEHGGTLFSTHMTQEVTTAPPWTGDPDGTGLALIRVTGQGELCWKMYVRDIALPATSSHIHKAVPGVRGDIVVVLSPPDATGKATGCTSGLNSDLLREILESPASFYVNVHTTDFPAGAIRGQLPS